LAALDLQQRTKLPMGPGGRKRLGDLGLSMPSAV
jgi:hypothetical protein